MAADRLKDEIIPSLKANARLKVSQYLAMNNVRAKVQPRCKLSYKVFEE